MQGIKISCKDKTVSIYIAGAANNAHMRAYYIKSRKILRRVIKGAKSSITVGCSKIRKADKNNLEYNKT
jgi:hypothetical protein